MFSEIDRYVLIFSKNKQKIFFDSFSFILHTLFESENGRQKIEPVPIPLPRAPRNFPDVKTRNIFFFFIIGLWR